MWRKWQRRGLLRLTSERKAKNKIQKKKKDVMSDNSSSSSYSVKTSLQSILSSTLIGNESQQVINAAVQTLSEVVCRASFLLNLIIRQNPNFTLNHSTILQMLKTVSSSPTSAGRPPTEGVSDLRGSLSVFYEQRLSDSFPDGKVPIQNLTTP